MEPSSSASFKRPRLLGTRPSCLVDGCTADLGKCRDYHRRHKVCEVHSKTSKVTISGQEQRFCQQCSRFHSLVEFDEGKRSCRKRLDGHNRRRRKPQPDSLSGRCHSGLQGLRHIPFSNPQMFSASGVSVTSSWLGNVKAESDLSSVSELNLSDQNGFLPQQLSFIHSNNPSLPGVSTCPPFLDVNPSSRNGGSSREMFTDGLNQAIDCDRVRSLLSSQPAETREIGFYPMVQSGPTSPLIPNWEYTCLAMEGEQVGTVLATDGSSNTDLHGHEMSRTRRRGSLSATGTHQTLSFSWDK